MENGHSEPVVTSIDYLQTVGQQHLLKYWPSLSPESKSSLEAQLKSLLPFDKLCGHFKKTQEDNSFLTDLHSKIHEIEEQYYGSYDATSDNEFNSFWKAGMKAIADGQVGLILLAGGQGTRLGVNYPKGMYDVGLPSKKTLYQLQAERIFHLQELARSFQQQDKVPVIAWYIMTSEATKEQTENYFKRNNYFGLKEKQIVFFEQGTMPCFTFDGKIILEAPDKIAIAPDGNGGLYKALLTSGALDDMKKRGILYLHVYCVDNILVRVADPIFVGYCITRRADCGNKVVEKKIPNEPVGVVCKVDGVGVCVVEYSEMPKDLTERLDKNGKLLYRAGNIANHFFTLDFLLQICSKHIDDLPYHVAKKKIPYVDDNGLVVKPKEPNGIKLEKFVFDVFPFSKNFYAWEVNREDEFSPLKNAEGVDSPATCREDLFNLYSRLGNADNEKFPLPPAL